MGTIITLIQTFKLYGLTRDCLQFLDYGYVYFIIIGNNPGDLVSFDIIHIINIYLRVRQNDIDQQTIRIYVGFFFYFEKKRGGVEYSLRLHQGTLRSSNCDRFKVYPKVIASR